MSFVRICDISKEPEHKILNPAFSFPYKSDPFQIHGFSAMDQGHNILCCAKTGSGKSDLAIYAIAHALRQGKRVFYTTPIKSLSNQKFHDLKQLWQAPGQVGIMTGDIKFCPTAPILIMTTEILRNLLYKQGTSTEHIGLTASLSLQDVGAVIFDECHYINDRDRGSVWEETMILLPKDIQLVMLSATLAHPELFADWIGQLKQVPCHVMTTEYRVVPLTHTVWNGQTKSFQTILNHKEEFQDDTYTTWRRGFAERTKAHEEYQEKVKAMRRAGHEGPISGKTRPKSFQYELSECLETLREKELLPALVFSFSRKGCESLASKTEQTFLDTSDQAAAQNIFDFHLRHHKHELETIPQYHTIRDLVKRGIAFHHSGLLPLLKEVIELLFSKGYIKLLYCTETFAVGINMPTKTVIFTGLEKRDDQGFRCVRTDEYIQMAGRAGRRGKDTQGLVIYLPEREPLSLPELRGILKGSRPNFQSRMTFHYNFLMKTFQGNNTDWLDILHKSYWYKLHALYMEKDKKELEDMINKETSIKPSEEVRKAFEQKAELELAVKQTKNAKQKQAVRALQAWKDEHDSPVWKMNEAKYTEWKNFMKDLVSLERYVEDEENYLDEIHPILNTLVIMGFLSASTTDDSLSSKSSPMYSLTKQGILATEFNEGHPILCANLACHPVIKEMSGPEFVVLCACFIDDTEKEEMPSLDELAVPSKVKEGFRVLESMVRDYQRVESAERIHSPTGYWNLSTVWMDAMWEWMDGAHAGALCKAYGLFEGNLVRSVLRLSNLVEEWIGVATLLNDFDLLKKLEETKPLLIRDIVVPDSLYLHL